MANIEWYRKAAKKALLSLRTSTPTARLADAQLLVAREHGFKSWRDLKAKLDIDAASALDPAAVKAFADALSRDRGDLPAVTALLDAHPGLANCKPWAPAWPHTAIAAAAHLCVWHRPKMQAIAALLLERGATSDLPTLARAGLLDRVISTLDANPTLLNIPDAAGRTPLYSAACTYGAFEPCINVALELLRRGATVDIFTAASWMMTDRLPALLADHPHLARAKDPEGLTPLHWVTRSDPNDPRQVQAAQMLLAAGADPNAPADSSDGMCPLHCAAEWASSIDLARLLLDHGALLDGRAAKSLWTPVDYALDRNRTDMRDFLRGLGAHTRQELDALSDPAAEGFLKLVHSGDLPAVRVALSAQPDLDHRTANHPVWGGRPQALHLTIERNDRPMFDLLLAHAASPDGDNALYDHWSPLMLAIHWKRDDMRDELLRRVHHLSLIDALMLADDTLALKILAAGQIMLQRPMPNDATMLHFARTPDAAERLIELGVSLTAKDKYGQTALDLAAKNHLHDLADLLIDHGATATPQTWATLGDLPRLQSTLATTPPGPQLLLTAVQARQVEITRWLLSLGLDPNTRQPDKSQATALHLAAWNGDLDTVNLLLSAGADRNLLDFEYKTTPAVWADTALEYTGNQACIPTAARLRQP